MYALGMLAVSALQRKNLLVGCPRILYFVGSPLMVQYILHRVLWLVPIIFQAIVATIMVVRGLHKQLPYFFSYTIFVVLTTLALLALLPYKQTYFWCYAIQSLISWVLGFALIYEIYATLLKEYAALRKMGEYLFWFLGLILVAIGLWAAVRASNPAGGVAPNPILSPEQVRVLQTLFTLERSVRIVECGLLVALFVFASFFGLSWKNYLFGIALGFAVFLSIQLAAVALRAYFGAGLTSVFNWLQQITYNLGVLVWTFYVIRRGYVADLRTLPRTELTAWNDTLQDLLHR